MSDPNLVYYTSFERLQCVLQYSTLKFKNTKSNNIFDTMGFVAILKNMPQFKALVDMTPLLNFILGYYQRESYCACLFFQIACAMITISSH